jgi:hypothetical protein
MRRGFHAQLVFSNAGNLVAIATGSDATTEHECGAKPMMMALTDGVNAQEATVKQLQATGLKKLLQVVSPIQYPNLLETKRISKLPPELQFVEQQTNEGPEAWFGLCRQPFPCYENELRLNKAFSSDADENVAGAWDERSFCIRVRGEKYVKALRLFWKAVQDGKVAFASSFMQRKGHLSGVVLANVQYISDDERANIRKAQAEMESNLRLRARDDSTELNRELTKILGNSPGYIWMRWKDAEESDIVYGVNPGYGVKIDWGTGYTRQQLLDWAQSGGSYQLTVRRDKVAA